MTLDATNNSRRPLDGLSVLEVADNVAGPYCGKLLASLGADVVKVEPPRSGDSSRRQGPFPGDSPHSERSGLFLYLNTGKRGTTLNLEDPQGRALLGQLAANAGVVIHDRQTPDLEAQGLGSSTLTSGNPALIIASVTPYGSWGPYAGYRAYDVNVFHAGGEGYLLPNGLALDTFPDRAPLAAGGQMGSYQGGLTAALGIVAAVFARNNGASGQVVDCSMQEAQLSLGYVPIQRLEAEGIVEDRSSRYFRVGGTLPAQDGYVELLTLEPRQWESLARMLDYPDWATAERFQNPGEYGPEINAHLREWSSAHTKEWLYREAQSHGVPFAPYLTPGEVFHSEQQRQRGLYVEVDHPSAGRLEYVGPPFRFGDGPDLLGRAPLLGEHNRAVYEGLGYSPMDIVELARAGVV